MSPLLSQRTPLTSLSQVAAIDAATGSTKWVFDPKVYENGLGIPANVGWRGPQHACSGLLRRPVRCGSWSALRHRNLRVLR